MLTPGDEVDSWDAFEGSPELRDGPKVHSAADDSFRESDECSIASAMDRISSGEARERDMEAGAGEEGEEAMLAW